MTRLVWLSPDGNTRVERNDACHTPSDADIELYRLGQKGNAWWQAYRDSCLKERKEALERGKTLVFVSEGWFYATEEAYREGPDMRLMWRLSPGSSSTTTPTTPGGSSPAASS